MKPITVLNLFCTCVVAAVICFVVFAYNHRHDNDPVPSKSDQLKLSKMLDEPGPVILYLFADDGKPVDAKVKAREWHAARRDMGKE